MVLTQLPERHTEIVRVVPFQEQLDINNSNMQIVSQIVNKKFITEMDLLRLQKRCWHAGWLRTVLFW